MSSVTTKHVDGDVAITRHVTAGGNANIKGSATIGHNLTIKGWLDATNVKTPNKGLFATLSDLNEAYPKPEPGWMALVGDRLPAEIYRAENGRWVDTGGTGGAMVIDNTIYSASVSEISEQVLGVQAQIDTFYNAVSEINTSLSQVTNTADKAWRLADNANDILGDVQENVAGLLERANEAEAKIGAANGVAQLDEHGKVPEAQLRPGIAEFDSFVSGVSIQPGSTLAMGGRVVYDTAKNRFLYATGGLASPKYYTSWNESLDYGEITGAGVRPASNRFYILAGEGRQYYWNGETLVETGAGAIDKLTPVRIESEEAFEAMKLLGLLEEGRIYYIPEED